MKQYINPEMEVTLIDVADIIQASYNNEGNVDYGEGDIIIPSKPKSIYADE